jgi:ppGpp synthetase/RelA/SpoT-type nucleotidyltranferase
LSGWSHDELVEAYEDARPRYERLAELMADALRESLKREGRTLVEVSGRAKTLDSFVKKAVRKGYADPFDEIGDKAGVRLVIPFASERGAIEPIAAATLDLSDRDDKRDGLDPSTLDYLGIHYQARLPADRLDEQDKGLAELEAELQIQTKAENAWAVAGHDLLYKAVLAVPAPIARRMMRLAALVEIFDDEVERFQGELGELPGYHELQALLPALERELVRFTARLPDPGISALIVPELVKLYDAPLERIHRDVVSPWLDAHRDELVELYRRYEDDPRANPLLSQPEAMMIFERLDADRFALAKAWPATVSTHWLESLALLRGVPTRELDS